MKKKYHEWLTVITISIIVATINVLHVIIGLAKTPDGFTYLATGHYYLDYFEYLEHIATGIAGHWIPLNYFATDPSLADWRFFPYILLGKIAWFFHLSPMVIYWIAVSLLTIFTLIGFYFLINLMLKKETFSLKIYAFLFSIFSGPVYKIFINNGQLILSPFDFWYGPASFIRRFEVVPYHALGLLLLIIIIVVIDKIWRKIPDLSNKEVVIRGFWVALLIVALMSFSPLSLVSLMPALLFVTAVHFIKFKRDRFQLFLFNFVILIMIIPVGLILRRYPGYGGINFEINWISRDPWWFVLLNIGPIMLFFPFGLRNYLKENSFLRQLLFMFTVVSYSLYISPAAYLLGVHNLRFFSSINYVFYGVLAVLGIKKISTLFKKHDKMVMIWISSLFILYSCTLTIYTVNRRMTGLDSGTPETVWTYLPSSIIEGLQSLNDYPEANVLTGPYGGIGMFVPIFSHRRVYVSHQIGTPDIEKKQITSNLFFEGKMTDQEAKKFIDSNKVGFIVLTSYDNFDSKIISRYSFLKPIFNKPSITIWKTTYDGPNKKN